MDTTIYYNNVLEHHGIKGQHWGERRYQNADGSYKPGAEGRYASNLRAIKNKARKVTSNAKSAISNAKKNHQLRKEGKEYMHAVARENKARVAASFVGGALLAYGGYKLGKKLSNSSTVAFGKSEVSTALSTIGNTASKSASYGLNEIVFDNRPKEIMRLARGTAAAGVIGTLAYNKHSTNAKRNNAMSSDADKLDEEFANTKQGKKLGLKYQKQIKKLNESEQFTEKDKEKFNKAEEDFLRASSRYQGQVLLKKYGAKNMKKYLKDKHANIGRDLVKSYEDYDWALHTY